MAESAASRVLLAGVESVPEIVAVFRVPVATDMQSVQQRSVSFVPVIRSGSRTTRSSAHDQQQRSNSSQTEKPTSRRDLLKGGASLGLGGIAARYAVCFASRVRVLVEVHRMLTSS